MHDFECIDDKLCRLGNAFRGLYTGRLFEENGHALKQGVQYSVTFLYRGEYCETPWAATVHDAFDYALEKLEV